MRALAAGQGSPSERGADRVIVLRHPVGHLAEVARVVETPLVVRADNKGWSLYEAQRRQPVAIGGKWDGPHDGSETVALSFRSNCSASNVRSVWSRSWSFRVENPD